MRGHRGYSPGWVRRIAHRYNERGVEGLGDRRHQNPGAKERALLDETEEAELLEALQGPPPGGGMWSGPKVARWIARRNGLEEVHVQRGFEYLRKLRYSPQVPRPENASAADASEQEAFKNSPQAGKGYQGGPSGGQGGRALLGRGRGEAGPQQAGDEEGMGSDRL